MKRYAAQTASLLAIASLLLLWGCNYRVYGGPRSASRDGGQAGQTGDAEYGGRTAGASLGAVKIGRIINRTTEPRLDDRMRIALAEELMRQGVNVVSSSPNEITAVIKGFTLNTLSEKRKYAAEYSVEIKADVVFKNENGAVRKFSAVSSPFIESFHSPDTVAGIVATKEIADEAALKNLSMYVIQEILHGRIKPAAKPRAVFDSVRIGGVENRTPQEGIDKKLRAAMEEDFSGGILKIEKTSPTGAGGGSAAQGVASPLTQGVAPPLTQGVAPPAASSSRTPELSAVITSYGLSAVAGGPDEAPRYEVEITADFTVKEFNGKTTLIKDVSSGMSEEKPAKTDTDGGTPERAGRAAKNAGGDSIESAEAQAIQRLLETLTAELTKRDDPKNGG